jgi:hypothetical protein
MFTREAEINNPNIPWAMPKESGVLRRWECRRCGAIGHLDIHCRVITRAMVAKAEAERLATVMARRAKAREMRALRKSAGVPRTPPVSGA